MPAVVHFKTHATASAANKYAAEFIGTLMLVFTVGMVASSIGDAVWGVAAIAMVLMVMVYALGPISGANFNPAVTIALFFQGAMDMETGLIYIVTQLLGGTVGALAAGYFVGFEKVATAGPAHGTTFLQALLGEYFYTWMLVFVVLNVAVAERVSGNQYFGLAIGLVIVAGGYGEGALSGGAYNPAVSLGLNIASYGKGALTFWSDLGWSLLYPVMHILASFTGVIMFHIVRPDMKKHAYTGDKFSFTAMAQKIEGYFPEKFTSELLGTFILVLTVGLNVLNPSKSKAPVFSIAASLAAMIFALGDVSGANFNPAVTLAIFMTEKIDGKSALEYVVAQLIGGLAAGFSSWLLIVNFQDHDRPSTFAFKPAAGATLNKALIGEFLATFVLAYVVLCTAIDLGNFKNGQAKDLLGYIIASCVICGGIAVGPISGGSLNPAVSVGASVPNIFAGVAEKDSHTFDWIYYSLFELFGGMFAALLYRFGTHSAFFEARAQARENSGVEQRAPLLA